MKKALALTLVLLLLTVSAFACAARDINSQQEQLIYTESILYGDPAAAQGIEVKASSTYRNQLFWDSVHSLDGAGTKTNFSFSEFAIQEKPSYTPEISLGTDYNITAYFSNNFSPHTGNPLDKAYQELIAETPDGGEGKKTVLLKDYYDYYPLSISITFPDYNLTLSPDTQHSYPPDSDKKLLYEAFESFIKIPVLPNETAELFADKDEYGQVRSLGLNTTEGGYYKPSHSAASADGFYFTVSNRSGSGELLDTSQIPGGYGIYFLSCDLSHEPGHFHIDGLSIAYPLSPEAETIDISTDLRKNELLLVTAEDSRAYLSVIDLADMSLKQKLEICQIIPTQDYNYTAADFYENFIVLYANDTFSVVSPDPQGNYELNYTAPRHPEGFDTSALSHPNQLAFDGERLCAVSILNFVSNDLYLNYTGFLVSIYDHTGLTYCAAYSSSLDAENKLSGLVQPCNFYGDAPLEIRFRP